MSFMQSEKHLIVKFLIFDKTSLAKSKTEEKISSPGKGPSSHCMTFVFAKVPKINKRALSVFASGSYLMDGLLCFIVSIYIFFLITIEQVKLQK